MMSYIQNRTPKQKLCFTLISCAVAGGVYYALTYANKTVYLEDTEDLGKLDWKYFVNSEALPDYQTNITKVITIIRDWILQDRQGIARSGGIINGTWQNGSYVGEHWNAARINMTEQAFWSMPNATQTIFVPTQAPLSLCEKISGALGAAALGALTMIGGDCLRRRLCPPAQNSPALVSMRSPLIDNDDVQNEYRAAAVVASPIDLSRRNLHQQFKAISTPASAGGSPGSAAASPAENARAFVGSAAATPGSAGGYPASPAASPRE